MMKKKTNFDLYLEKQLKDPGFAEKFRKAGKAWDLAIQTRFPFVRRLGCLRKNWLKGLGHLNSNQPSGIAFL